jgi:hypothetical protein
MSNIKAAIQRFCKYILASQTPSKRVKFETYQVADLSTKYITQEDGALIGDVEAPGHVAALDSWGSTADSPGDIFAVPTSQELLDSRIAELKAFGFSEHFVAIFQHLLDQQIPYIRFDTDGGEADGLPMFDW